MAATVTPRRVRIAATVSAVVLGGSFLGASTAQAVAPNTGASDSTSTAAAHPHRPYGVVTARTGLNVRQYPSKDSSVRGVLRHHQKVGLGCKVHAQRIAGNSLWYKLRGSNEAWVAARYVKNHGYVPLCKKRYRTSLTDSEQSRKAMG